MNDMLTVKEATEIFHARGFRGRKDRPVSRTTVQKWAARGWLAGAVRIGERFRGVWMIPRATAETFEQRTVGRPRSANYRPRNRAVSGA